MESHPSLGKGERRIGKRSLLRLAALLLLALFTSGCVTMYDPEASQEQHPDVIFTLQEGQTLGQTFIARRAGLDRLGLWLSLPPETKAGDGLVTVAIYSAATGTNPKTSSPLRVASFALSTAERPGPLVLNLEPLPGQAGQLYYLDLKVTSGVVQVSGRDEDIYPGGQAFPNGLPAESDLAFQLSYEYNFTAFLADLKMALRQAWLLLPLLAVLFLPGWVLLEVAKVGRRYEPGERLALALGLSLSAWPVAMTWTTWLGLRWTRNGVLLAAVLLLAIAIYYWLRRTDDLPPRLLSGDVGKKKEFLSHSFAVRKREKGDLYPVLILLVIVLFSFGVRLVMVRDLAAPSWVDSVHHAMIIRLVQMNGGFPSTYAPFLDLTSASYHSGFHATAAVFQWLSGMDLPAGLLLFGQVLNALMTLAAYLLTLRLGAGRVAGLAAALIVGVFTPMPAYYTSWGRYTQLAGLIILPAAFALVQDVVVGAKHSLRGPILLAGLVCGGLSLVHYRVAAFLAALILAWLVITAYQFRDWFGLANKARLSHGEEQSSAKGWSLLRRFTPHNDNWMAQITWSLILCAMAALLLTLPWWPQALVNLIVPWSRITGTGGASGSTSGFTALTGSFQTSASGKWVLWLAGFSAVLALLRRSSVALVATLLLWFGLLFLSANLPALGLPGRYLINSITVEISLFLPTSIMGGFLTGRLLSGAAQVFPQRWLRVIWPVVVLGALGLAVAGSTRLLTLLNPATFQFRQADRPALAWIEANTPPQAAFWINPFAWVSSTYAGEDGGAWIPALALRRTLPPPVLSVLEGHTQQLDLTRAVQEGIQASSDPVTLAGFLKRSGIDYVYIGRHGGLLSPRLLASSPLFEQVYEQDGVWIFKIQ